jgi:hypothetical protein
MIVQPADSTHESAISAHRRPGERAGSGSIVVRDIGAVASRKRLPAARHSAKQIFAGDGQPA